MIGMAVAARVVVDIVVVAGGELLSAVPVLLVHIAVGSAVWGGRWQWW